MPEELQLSCRYQILRYVPNLVRDEWVNVGVLLEEVPEGAVADVAPRCEIRLIEEDAEIARVRRLHPGVDESLLRSLPGEFEARLRAPSAQVATYLEKLDQTLSTTLQFGPRKGILTDDFDSELERLFREQVSVPRTARTGVIETTTQWIRKRIDDVFRRRHILARLQKKIRVDEFTGPGDPTRIDYGYRFNGTRGYMQIVPLKGDTSRAKVFAYTAGSIRRRMGHSEFVALTETDPISGNTRHEFVKRLFDDQGITIVPPTGLDRFAETLRPRLQ
ncbi:MAG TPA: DUF3037 domain-containing protein [Candidatus Acidoferrales bacterium]